MLKIKNLTKIYTSKNGTAVEALSNVSLNFGDKGLVFFLGKSGSGKSTLLNLLGGLDTPTSGEIVINDRSSLSFTETDFDNYRNTYVGFVFQEYNLIENYTVGTNIGLALELQGKKADRNEINKILQKVDLIEKGETLFDRYVDELSGGQKQRVAIARALIKNPEIILADEPTGALDSKTGQQFFDLLRELSKEKLIIVVSHDRKNAKKYADRIIELHDGKIISDVENVDKSSSFKSKETQKKKAIFIKSKLPLKRSLIMGASALKTKPFRLIISILLTVIANVIVGFALTVSGTNTTDVQLRNLFENGQTMVTLNGCAIDSKGNIIGNKALTSSQMDVIKKYNNNIDPMFLRSALYEQSFEINDYFGNLNNFPSLFSYEQILNHDYSSTRLVEINSETGETDANLKPDPRFINKTLCCLPRTNDEIAITDFYADIFMERGYKEYEENELETDDADNSVIKEINSPDDLIGQKLGNFTICGVYSTEQSHIIYENEYRNYDGDYAFFLCRGLSVSTIAYGFVCKGYGENSPVSSVLIKLSGDINQDQTLLKNLTYKIGQDTYSSVYLESVYFGLVSALSYLDNEIAYIVEAVPAVLFSTFAILLTINFLSVNIDFRKKELGILRACGARKKDVFMVCLGESMLIATIEFVISLITLLILCFYLNNIYIAILFVGFWQIIGLFLLSFGISALATILPIRKLAKKKPIDIINFKEN